MKSLQFITHYTERYSYLDSARMALEGGCRWIQLRMKDAGKEEILPIATEIRKLCNDCGAIFIIDDHVELVREIRADGVHLGKNDMPVAEARRILGDEYIIGGTANTYEDVKKHWLDGVNYIGCGPFRYTTTKQKLSPILGLEGYKEIITFYSDNTGRWESVNIHDNTSNLDPFTYTMDDKEDKFIIDFGDNSPETYYYNISDNKMKLMYEDGHVELYTKQ